MSGRLHGWWVCNQLMEEAEQGPNTRVVESFPNGRLGFPSTHSLFCPGPYTESPKLPLTLLGLNFESCFGKETQGASSLWGPMQRPGLPVLTHDSLFRVGCGLFANGRGTMRSCGGTDKSLTGIPLWGPMAACSWSPEL